MKDVKEKKITEGAKYLEFLEREVLRLRTENKELKATIEKQRIKSKDVIVVGKGAFVLNWKG